MTKGIRGSGWSLIVLENEHPTRISISFLRDNRGAFNVRDCYNLASMLMRACLLADPVYTQRRMQEEMLYGADIGKEFGE